MAIKHARNIDNT